MDSTKKNKARAAAMLAVGLLLSGCATTGAPLVTPCQGWLGAELALAVVQQQVAAQRVAACTLPLPTPPTEPTPPPPAIAPCEKAVTPTPPGAQQAKPAGTEPPTAVPTKDDTGTWRHSQAGPPTPNLEKHMSTESSPEAAPEPIPTAEPMPPEASAVEQRAQPSPTEQKLLEVDWQGPLHEKRAAELRAAAQEAEEAAEKANSPMRTVLNAALWAGGVALFGWGINKLLTMAEARQSRERFPRDTEDAHAEPATAQPAEAVA